MEGSSASFTSKFEILRGDLAAVSYEATKDHPNLNYMCGTTIQKIVSNDSDTFKVELSNGSCRTSTSWLQQTADGQRCERSASLHSLLMWSIWDQALESRIITLRPDPYGTIRAMFICMP